MPPSYSLIHRALREEILSSHRSEAETLPANESTSDAPGNAILDSALVQLGAYELTASFGSLPRDCSGRDLAYALPPDAIADLAVQQGEGKMSAFRHAAAQTERSLPNTNCDLSRLFVQQHLATTVERCLDIVRTISALIVKFDTVETDNPHLAALAAMLGRDVNFFPEANLRNADVLCSDLTRFPGVRISEPKGTATTSVSPPGMNDDLVRSLSSELQMVRRRALRYAAEIDEAHRRADIASTFMESRAYWLWMKYLAIYDMPGVGRSLRKFRDTLDKWWRKRRSVNR